MTADYPAIIRQALAHHRAHNRDFERAWGYTIADHPTPEDWACCMDFMRRHMKAAYYQDGSAMGKWRGPTSAVAGGTGTRVPVAVSESDAAPLCRWGDGCGEVATRGRFGLFWCDEHGKLLEGMRLNWGDGRETRKSETKVAA